MSKACRHGVQDKDDVLIALSRIRSIHQRLRAKEKKEGSRFTAGEVDSGSHPRRRSDLFRLFTFLKLQSSSAFDPLNRDTSRRDICII